MAAKRRLKSAAITHLSLCRKGRNKLKTLMKSGDRFVVPTLSKMDEVEGLLYALVYTPEFPDTDGDIMSAAEITKMCHGFLTNGGNIDVEHDLNPLDANQAQIAETLIVQKGDDRFSGITYDGATIDPTGSWGIVLKILDPELKKAYADGEWDGVSMFGQCEATPVHKHQPQPKKSLMDEEAIKALVAKAVADGITASKAADAEAKRVADIAKAEAKAKEGVKFEGDPTKVEDIAKHEAKLAASKVDWNDPKSVADYKATLAKAEDKPEETEEVKAIKAKQVELQKSLDAIESSSNVEGQDASDDTDVGDGDELTFGLSKSEMGGAALGRELAMRATGTWDEAKETASGK